VTLKRTLLFLVIGLSLLLVNDIWCLIRYHEYISIFLLGPDTVLLHLPLLLFSIALYRLQARSGR
jgi:hypothetical protein